MEPRAYLPIVLEAEYAAAHPDLTPAARELLHEEVAQHPERYVTSPRAEALVAYAQAHRDLMRGIDRIIDLPEEEFTARRLELFAAVGARLKEALRCDPDCFEARLLMTLLADTDLDSCLHDLLILEHEVLERLHAAYPAFDENAPHLWRSSKPAEGENHAGDTAAAPGAAPATGFAARALGNRTQPPADPEEAAALTSSNPVLIAWLHTLESISGFCLQSARYRAALRYAQIVGRACGYPNCAFGTELLAYARLEDEDAFFACARAYNENHPDEGPVEDTPWYLFGRALLLYKLGKMRPAARAIKDFAARTCGGAYFLTMPVYHVPYLPVRPEPTEPWERAHQALFEADGMIVDVPDFAQWAEGFDEVRRAADRFADTYGFE